ncbi:Pre-mRNA-splicing factor SPF27 [Chaetomidium leptoderma]|uniref:Pre-mRNA-splicing factor SPF27 n=1 Tax=Chaetomidium leptoderma TaxID=669021 RepID=A0AAN6VR57_9PEZI|nr:Pre-mRNA-splicing factor SPF27 [Chaetomidium leptoderma]
MAPITAVHESLPYIDPDPTPTERAAAEALITAERSLVPDDPHHALLPPPPPSTATSPFLTPLLRAELQRLSSSSSSTDTTAAAHNKLTALDLTRYEALDPPSPTTLASLPPPSAAALLQQTLARAYTSHAHIASRRTHLALLDSHGKNAWLVGNHFLEAELRALEAELAGCRREIDLVTLQRKETQQGGGAGPEMEALEEAWKRGVGRVLETEAAAEGLRREVLEVRRGMV